MRIKMTELADEIRKVAEASPDVVYQERAVELDAPHPNSVYRPSGHRFCRYQAGGQGCCIVGVALENLGVPIERLAEYDGPSERSFYGVFMEFPEDFIVDDEEAFRFVRYAQDSQDDGLPWGECVTE